MKNIIKYVSIVALLAAFSLPVQATNAKEYSSIYNEEQLELIDELKKINPQFDLNEGELVLITKVIKELDVANSLKQRGTIGASYMTMYVTSQRINSTNTTYDDFKFQLTADWRVAPLFRMQDAIAICWSDEFTLYELSCDAYYNGIGLVSGKTNQITNAPEYGVGFSVESSNWYGRSLDYAVLTAKVRKYNDAGTASVYGAYAHATAGLGIGFLISFNNTGGIGFSAVGGHDTMSKSDYFSY